MLWKICAKFAFTGMNTWEQIKIRISTKISAEAFQNWVSRTSFLSMDGGSLSVSAPDEATRRWMQEEYAGEVWAAIHELGLSVQQVVYRDPVREGDGPGPGGYGGSGEELFTPTINLNPKFTFENFVVGACNQFAHAAARAVANNPVAQLQPAVHLRRRRAWARRT